MGAKGYAVRLQPELQGAFDARCKQLGITSSSALHAAVVLWLAPRPTEASRLRRAGPVGSVPQGSLGSAGHRVHVQIGPTEPKPGSRLKVKK